MRRTNRHGQSSYDGIDTRVGAVGSKLFEPCVRLKWGVAHSCETGETGDLSMAMLIDALSDKTRRQIVYRLSVQPTLCTGFGDLGSKTRLSYHYAQLRKAGLTSTEKHGTSLLISLRLQEIEEVFPGFLKSVLKGIEAEHRKELGEHQDGAFTSALKAKR